MSADLAADLVYWKAALGLGAWTVDLKVVRHWDMPMNRPVTGCCERWPENQRAQIHLLDPLDHGGSAFVVDLEVTLVHEILHIFHACGEHGTVAYLMEEQGVEMTARALVRLRRQGECH